MKKGKWFPLLTSVGTMALLYLIGNTFDLSLLRFSIVLNEQLNEGFFFSADISFLPIVTGLIVGYIVERSLKMKM
ncbi:hypothetical protein [Litchfieldia salsa]|uniref:Uncharacterized protein n=1 Tax=Litchfieldia salsa TaxID=930152 RepID=A0A1H0PGE6_9BACI|nr:hypothetical protein [Litchfieldia salsa]SDP04137.1 hypothetical protein SAMN05216565_101308 [Litchfieldia salsa]